MWVLADLPAVVFWDQIIFRSNDLSKKRSSVEVRAPPSLHAEDFICSLEEAGTPKQASWREQFIRGRNRGLRWFISVFDVHLDRSQMKECFAFICLKPLSQRLWRSLILSPARCNYP